MNNPIQLTEINPIQNSLGPLSWRCRALFIPLVIALASLAASPAARAVCQQGCGGADNTFLGDDALQNTFGSNNTAVGATALFHNSSGNDNTATGGQALYWNDTGNANTACGYQALLQNIGGSDNTAVGWSALIANSSGVNNTAVGSTAGWNVQGDNNTAVGTQALNNLDGNNNTAIGYLALFGGNEYLGGDSNTANGAYALQSNDGGSFNTASGASALNSNTTGIWNTANGWGALYSNIDGSYNMADGLQALFSNKSGTYNTACGLNALFSNTTGGNNIGLGVGAGGALNTGSNNIDIGNSGVAGESAKIRIGTKGTHKNTYIAGIYGVTAARGIGVFIDSNGHLGTTTSSERFKEAIRSMDKASEAILALLPVTFRYKHEFDPDGIPQFGLVAEQVAKVNPDLVARDEQGKPYTVRYEAVNAMLLNEFLKEHRKVETLQGTVAELKAMVKEQAAEIQRVSAQVVVNETTPRVADK